MTTTLATLATTLATTPSGRWPVGHREACLSAGFGIPCRDLWPVARVQCWLAAGVTPVELVDAIRQVNDEGEDRPVQELHRYASLSGVQYRRHLRRGGGWWDFPSPP